MGSIYVIILSLIGAFVAFGLYYLLDWATTRAREIAHERMLQDVARRLKREEEAQEWNAYVRGKRDEWDLKRAAGTVLDLTRDDRQILLGKSAKDLTWAKRQSLRKDVREWCKDNCQGEFSVVPTFDGRSNRYQIWFSDPNDAFMFKLRWY